MTDRLTIIPGKLDLDTLASVYRRFTPIELDRNCRANVQKAADVVTSAAAQDGAIYGINTGFGKLAHTRIAPEQTADLQRNLILSHCCGVGPNLAPGIVRMVLVMKLASLGRGASGVSWKLLEMLEQLFNSGALPVIPAKGSVGASGDLAPLAHLTAVVLGEGKVTVDGSEVPSRWSLEENDIEPIELGPKEGLAMINGTQVSTALALAGLFDGWTNARSALVTGALASDALMASTAPFRSEVHELRQHPGQVDAALSLRSLLAGSDIRESHRDDDERVQDPYCLRCQPQVMGACIDQFRHIATTLETEANSVTDNPVVITASGEIISGGNFHAEPVAFAADQCAIVMAEIGSITERRIATLVDPALNYGLPAFLSPDPGLNSGFMVAEITAAALMSENKHLAAPCSTDSTPTSANQEDHVSMACHAAFRLIEMNRNLSTIIGIELLAAAQGVQFREPVETSEPLKAVIDRLRSVVERLDEDRFMADDLARAAELVANGELLHIVGSDKIPHWYRARRK